jgi:hypothetical protein
MPQQKYILSNDEIDQIKAQLDWAWNLKHERLFQEHQDVLTRFVLMFNVFESLLFKQDNQQGRGKVCNEICTDLKNETDWFNVKDYAEFGEFFIDRLNSRLHRLFFKSPKENELVVKLVERQYVDDPFEVYLIIAYYYRNKFFHGIKDWFEIKEDQNYVECFIKIACMLHKLLSDMLNNQFIGLDHKYPKPTRTPAKPRASPKP